MTPTQGFNLPLGSGLGRLELPCTAPGEGLAQARALACALPALATLESWLAMDLPCPEPALPHAGPEGRNNATALSLPFDADTALAGGRLLLPWSVLKPGRAAPAHLPVDWPSWTARVCLQVLPSQRIAFGGLVPGAVLLLPAGFQRGWPVQLRAVSPNVTTPPAGWQVAASWQPHEARLVLPGGPVQAGHEAAAPMVWSVWLTAPAAVDMRAWFGGCGEAASLATGQVELHLGSQAVAWGRLLPCGAGWGLRIERVESLELAAAWT